MSIIEELVKSKFSDERERVVISLYVTANLMAAYSEKIISAHGLTGSWLNVLRILRGQYPNPSRMSLISERIVDKKTDLSRMMARLYKAGLIERHKHINDKRTRHVIISKKGLDMLAMLDKEKDRLLKPTLCLSEEEAKQLNLLLEKMLSELTV